jgi:hypothetical protein
MRTRLMRGKATLLFMMLGLLLAVPAIAFAQDLTGSTTSPVVPTIQSDKADYAPGELVTLTGSGWQPGESVNIVVNDDVGQTWNRNVNVTADASGNISDSFNLPDWFVATYTVTATGVTSGTATHTFTDALPSTTAVTSSVNPSSVGQSVTFTAKVTFTNTGSGHTAGEAVTEGTVVFGTGGNDNCAGTGWNQLQAPTTLTSASGGQVTYTTSSLAAGSTVIKACYDNPGAGSTGAGQSSGTFTQTVSACTAPSVTTQPANQPITYGANASFTAAASGTSPTVKWQKSTDNGANWTDISGATSTTLTLTKPSVSDSNSKYRAVFTNSCGSATSNGSATLQVAKKALTINGAVANNKEYDGTTTATVNFSGASLAGGVVSGDTVTIDSSGYSASFASKTVGTSKAVTVTGVTLGGVDAANYSVSQPSGLTANITAKALTINGAVANNKQYDGGTSATVNFSGASLAGGVASGDTVTINSSGYSASFASKTVGTNKPVTVTGVALGGTDAANYSVSQPSGLTANITAKQLTGSFTANNKQYDGGTSATVDTRSLPGVISPDTVNLDITNAQFDTASVGNGKTVSADLALSGAQAGNYSLSSATATTTANITPKALTGSFTANNKQYDATRDATVATKTLPGVIGTDAVTLNVTNALFDTKNVGTDKDVTGSLSLSGNDAGNYTVNASHTTKANITAKDITGNFTASNKTYDGTTDATVTGRSLNGTITGDNVSLSGGTASFGTKDVATGKTVTLSGASLSGTDAGNYHLTSVGTATADITAKDITGNFTASNKVYDGNTDATVTGRSLNGTISGDTVSLDGGTASFGTKNVATGKTVTLSGASLSGTDAGNYHLTSVATATANITPKGITGSFTAQNKVYDGSRDATVASRSLDGVISGDTVNLDLANVLFNTKDVGNGKDVTGSLSLSGTDAGNYTVNASHTTKANITPKALTISGLSAQNKVYDGNNNATITGTPQLQGVIAPDDVSLSGTASGTFNDASVNNNKPVTVSGLSLAGADKGNYSLTLPTLSANITSWNAQGYGFYAPVGVDNSEFVAAPATPRAVNDTGAWNTIKGGSTVPLKFNVYAGTVEKTSLSDIKGLTAQKLAACTAEGTAVNDPVDFTTTETTSLRYDTTAKQWIQNWKTSKVTSDTCYRATVTFADNSSISAFFKLLK